MTGLHADPLGAPWVTSHRSSLQALIWKLDITTQHLPALCSLSFALICVQCKNAYEILSWEKEQGRRRETSWCKIHLKWRLSYWITGYVLVIGSPSSIHCILLISINQKGSNSLFGPLIKGNILHFQNG